MLIFDKKDENILVHEMIPKLEEIRRYRESVISQHGNESLFYSLKTNCLRIIEDFNKYNEMSLSLLDYFNIDGFYIGTEYSSLDFASFDKDIIEKYLSGLYDDLKPIIVSNYINGDKEIVHRFLRTTRMREVNINFNKTWEFNNLMDLPRELYFLQLLLLNQYDKLVDENIKKQLSLFDINYLRSVSILDVKNMLDTGLVSGTLDNIMKK